MVVCTRHHHAPVPTPSLGLGLGPLGVCGRWACLEEGSSRYPRPWIRPAPAPAPAPGQERGNARPGESRAPPHPRVVVVEEAAAPRVKGGTPTPRVVVVCGTSRWRCWDWRRGRPMASTTSDAASLAGAGPAQAEPQRGQACRGGQESLRDRSQTASHRATYRQSLERASGRSKRRHSLPRGWDCVHRAEPAGQPRWELSENLLPAVSRRGRRPCPWGCPCHVERATRRAMQPQPTAEPGRRSQTPSRPTPCCRHLVASAELAREAGARGGRAATTQHTAHPTPRATGEGAALPDQAEVWPAASRRLPAPEPDPETPPPRPLSTETNTPEEAQAVEGGGLAPSTQPCPSLRCS